MEYSLFVDGDFDARKAAHMAAHFLLKAGEPLSTLRAVGLMHLANVLAEQLHGVPLVKDRVAVFPTGPVPQNLTALVRGRGLYSRHPQWSELIDQIPDRSIWLARPSTADDLHRLNERDRHVLDVEQVGH